VKGLSCGFRFSHYFLGRGGGFCLVNGCSDVLGEVAIRLKAL